jgi:hypothetical protein
MCLTVSPFRPGHGTGFRNDLTGASLDHCTNGSLSQVGRGWEDIDFAQNTLAVTHSKTPGGEDTIKAENDPSLRQRVLVTLNEIERMPDPRPLGSEIAVRHQVIDRVFAMIHQLDLFDRQIIVAYLEGWTHRLGHALCGMSPTILISADY